MFNLLNIDCKHEKLGDYDYYYKKYVFIQKGFN